MSFKKILICIVIILTTFVVACTYQEDNNSENNNQVIETDDHLKENGDNSTENPADQSPDLLMLQIENMTLEEKIGQLILVGMQGYEVNNNIKELIETYHVGGVILYKKNVENTNQLLSLIDNLKYSNDSNKIPLFISVDEEGGSVSRNPNEINKFPTARSIGKLEDNNLAFESGRLLGQIVRNFGYNMNFAPVLDIDSNPLNPVIGDRSFGDTAEVVSNMGYEVLSGIKAEGVIPVIKHFPGHGDTSVDSHIGLPVVEHDLERIRNFEIVPFKHAIDKGADVVMVAHILMSEIDSEYPSSMSRIIITDILREELGFSGVVITDDMTMGAIEKNYNMGDGAIQSIKAGADIILVGHDYEKALIVFRAIKQEVESGNISLERVDESVYRILKLKEKYKIKDLSNKDLDIHKINKDITNLVNKVKSSDLN